MKKGMSSLDIMAMVGELQYLIGGYIEKIYQPVKNHVVISVNIPKGAKEHLHIILGKWIYISKQSMEMPKAPSPYAMLLRKYLNNGRITSIEQHEFDRVVLITIQKKAAYQLVVELFGNGNIVLVSEGKIIQPFTSKSWSHRELKAHAPYIFPPSRMDPREIHYKDFKDLLEASNKDLVRTLAMDLNLGGTLAEELCLLSDIPKHKNVADVSDESKKALFYNLERCLESVEKGKSGLIFFENEELVNVSPIKLRVHEGARIQNYETVSEAIETIVAHDGEEKAISDDEQQALIERYKRQLAQQTDTIEKMEKDEKEFQDKAELIYGHYQTLDNLIKFASENEQNLTPEELERRFPRKEDFQGIEIRNRSLIIRLRDKNCLPVDLILDYNRSLNENASIYYEKTKRSKEKLKGAKIALTETESKLSEAIRESEKVKVSKNWPKKTFWFEAYRWFISSDDNIIVAGRDAKTNDKVVKKYLKDNDRYVHADVHGAPSVVVKHKEDDISEQSLEEACIFALAFSKAWNAKIGSGSAYWVRPDQVSKTPMSGEFLPKGAFIVRGKRNIKPHIKPQLAVGEINYEGVRKIMCGPLSAVKAHSKKYVIFEPGEMKKHVLAKKLSIAFDAPIDVIMKVLPPGDVRILERINVDL